MFKKSLVVLFVMALGMMSAHATPITFTNKTNFLNAVSSPTLESFEGLATTSQNADQIITQSFAMTLTPLSSGEFRWLVSNSSRPTAGTEPTHGTNFIEAATRAAVGAQIQIDLDFKRPVRSFGLHVGDFGDLASTGQLKLTTMRGDEFLLAENPPQRANGNVIFFGLSNLIPTKRFTLTKTTFTDGITLDEIYFTTIPTPSTFSLAIVGLLGLCAARCQQRNRRVA